MSGRAGKEQAGCQVKPGGLWGWLTCWLCWEVKAGVALLGVAWIALLWDGLPHPAWRSIAGWACYWSGVACLLYGLGSDVSIIAKALRSWQRRRRH